MADWHTLQSVPLPTMFKTSVYYGTRNRPQK